YPDENRIVIANAGTHQLWTYDRMKKKLSLLAGNGRESIDDGMPPLNSLSQPSGLSAAGDKLYLADAETSALRVVEGKELTTLIGTGLFDFGLKDGEQGEALMQHPLGVYADGETIYIADTYNHRLRQYEDGTLSTLSVKGLKEHNNKLKIIYNLYVTDDIIQHTL